MRLFVVFRLLKERIRQTPERGGRWLHAWIAAFLYAGVAFVPSIAGTRLMRRAVLAVVLLAALMCTAEALAAPPLQIGDILVADVTHNLLIRVNPTTGAQDVFTSWPGIGGPIDLIVTPFGRIFSTYQRHPSLQVLESIDPVTGVTQTVAAMTPDNYLGRIATTHNGTLFVTANTCCEIGGELLTSVQSVDLLQGSFNSLASGDLLQGSGAGIAVDGNGVAYVTGQNPAKIVRVDLATGVQTILTSNGWLGGSAQGLKFDGQGDLIALTGSLGNVVRVNTTTGEQTLITGHGLFLKDSQFLAITPSGDALVSDYGACAIIRVNLQTGAQSIVSSGGLLCSVGQDPYIAGIAVYDGLIDTDGDGDPDGADNCPSTANADQADVDGDLVGDVCDNCLDTPNQTQVDLDADLVGDACDNCPTISNTDQADVDADLVGDVCDNCQDTSNASQADSDSDFVGDACDSCVAVPNPRVPGGWLASNPWAVLTGGQRDDDFDGFGNKCDGKFPGSLGSGVNAADTALYKASIGHDRTTATCGTPVGFGTLPCAIFDLDEGTAIGITAADTARYKLLIGYAPGPRCTACPLTCEAGALRSCEP